ncbi:uncharacterized protein LOC129748779 [Uranotaenia lowii]|uniref:uncharacterized protein LOC129739537 n=1 Tax=Uranotaenia lowii TaxID=190385 RepID=UPI002478F312|nr:uncharacterized protein LOC129739537 [Uranotaenia lowii]XP_055599497.1 uncharacterized protein LOC129748779 [Uranotaenia lowii]
MAEEEQRLLDDLCCAGLGRDFIQTLSDCGIGLKELCSLTLAQLTGALQRISLGPGQRWDYKVIYSSILDWQKRNENAIYDLINVQYELTESSQRGNIVELIDQPGTKDEVTFDYVYSVQTADTKVELESESFESNISVAPSNSHYPDEAGPSRSSHESPEIRPKNSADGSEVNNTESISSNISITPSNTYSPDKAGPSGSNHASHEIRSRNSADGPEVSNPLKVVDRSAAFFSPAVLRDLLESTELGRDIVRRAKGGELSKGRQRELAGIVASWHLKNRNRTLKEYLKEYALTVVSVFPNESQSTYFLEAAGDKKCSTGLIPNRINNERAKRRKRELHETQHAKRLKNGNQWDVDEPKVQPSLSLDWLRRNQAPWTTVIDKWQETFNHRRTWLCKPTTINKLKDNNLWALIASRYGYQLICSDFDLIVNPTTKGSQKLQKILADLYKYIQPRISEESALVMLDAALNADASTDTQLCTLLILLNCVLLPVKVARGFKPTILYAQAETVLFAETRQLAVEKYKELCSRLKDLGLPAAPKIVARGRGPTQLQNTFYVIYEELCYELPTLLQAVDVLMQLSHVLGIKHSKVSKQIWLFLARYVYSICTPEKYKSIEKLAVHLQNVQATGNRMLC